MGMALPSCGTPGCPRADSGLGMPRFMHSVSTSMLSARVGWNLYETGQKQLVSQSENTALFPPGPLLQESRA